MSIAIGEEHRTLAATVDSFLRAQGTLTAARDLLEAPAAGLPGTWKRFAELGWLGLHLPEEHGGAGYGLPELVVLLEQTGRHVTPGPLLPTVTASAVLADRGGDALRAALLPGLADGSRTAALGLGGNLTLRHEAGGDAILDGDGGVVLGGDGVDLLVLAAGDDLVVLDAAAEGVSRTVPAALDPSRRSARVRLDAVRVPADRVLTGARERALAVQRVLAAAEAVGGAAACTDMATAYAKERVQFGRPIGSFQAVKHHCANMFVAAELATAAVWDAARAASDDEDQFALAAAVAAHLAIPAFTSNTSLNIQVHGGIGFTWEHDAHLFQRRALTLAAVVSGESAAADVLRLNAAGVRRPLAVALPPEAEAAREGIRADAAAIAALPKDDRYRALTETGYLVPHWPKPFGRAAAAGEQLVIDEEFAAAGIRRPVLGITGWVLLTIIQHGTAEQIDRLVRPSLEAGTVWCQLFSEPDAGSDAAGIRTRARKVDGGWVVNGQKVWTSGAHLAAKGLATVRTDPEAPKHKGVTTLVVDMSAPGVEIRPLRMITGNSDFNEVFFTDVFVPDEDVIGEVHQGWTVARATMGNERVSLGSGQGHESSRADLAKLVAAYGGALPGAGARAGAIIAEGHAIDLLNARGAERAVTGAPPGPEGNVTKLLLAEHVVRRAAFVAELHGPDLAFTEGPGMAAALTALGARAMTIAGGTSEITRNQIGERILGLPREPGLR